jgi:hypothetical protein
MLRTNWDRHLDQTLIARIRVAGCRLLDFTLRTGDAFCPRYSPVEILQADTFPSRPQGIACTTQSASGISDSTWPMQPTAAPMADHPA